MKATCYMCEELATTREHVPPKCLFPKHDAYRRNLITVPSCRAHNSGKSKDDEYLRAILCICPGINSLGQSMLSNKVLKAIKRSPHHFDTFYPNVQPVYTPYGETGAFTIERVRFDEAVSRIARALYFLTFNIKLTRPLWVASDIFRDRDLSLTPYHAVLARGEATLPNSWKGTNPAVFSYTVDRSKSAGRKFVCRMKFYQACLVYVGSMDW